MESNGLGCTLCKKEGHRASKCPELYEDIYGKFNGSDVDGGFHIWNEDHSEPTSYSVSSDKELGKVEMVVP